MRITITRRGVVMCSLPHKPLLEKYACKFAHLWFQVVPLYQVHAHHHFLSRIHEEKKGFYMWNFFVYLPHIVHNLYFAALLGKNCKLGVACHRPEFKQYF